MHDCHREIAAWLVPMGDYTSRVDAVGNLRLLYAAAKLDHRACSSVRTWIPSRMRDRMMAFLVLFLVSRY